MITLDATTKSLEVFLSGSVATTQWPITVSYTDINDSSQSITNSEVDIASNNTSTVTILGAPGSGVSRVVEYITIYNPDATTLSVTVQFNDNTTERTLWKQSLSTGQTLQYVKGGGWTPNPFAVTVSSGSVTVSGTVTATQGTAAAVGSAWPVEVTDGTNVLGTNAHPVRVDPTGVSSQPVTQSTGAALAGAWPVLVTDGASVLGTPSNPLRVDPTGTTSQTISGTVTGNQGSANSVGNGWPVKLTDGSNVLGTSTHPVRNDPVGTTTQPVGGVVAAGSAISGAANPIVIAGSDYGGTPDVRTAKVDSSGFVHCALEAGSANVGNVALLAGSANVGNVSLLAGSQQIGSLAAHQSTNVDQWSGAAVSTGNGTTDVGTLRVTVSSDSTGQVQVDITTSSTGTQTSVAGSASSGTILASNTSRKGASVFNDSSAILYLRLSSSTASTSNYTVQLSPNAFYELSLPCYTGAITGIWSSATGNARVTELT